MGSKPISVVFGAGNVGRGFLGQIFTESDYQVVFVDIDEALLRALNAKQGYRLRLVDSRGSEELLIAPIRALHAGDVEAVAAAVARASLVATAAGVRALPAVACSVAAGLARRLVDTHAEPLNIIVCENLKDAADFFRGLVNEALPAELQAALREHVGFVDAVIGRMVPLLTPEQRAEDPSLIIAEPYKELPVDRRGFVGEVPAVVGLEACDHFAAYVARKLYIHNGGHAVLGYLGYLRGWVYGHQTLADPVVARTLDAAWAEATAGIARAHQVSPRWLEAHANDLRTRFANQALGDTVVRLARDPLRKLAPDDRLVGAARLAEAAGVMPRALAWAIAAAYCFSAPEDPVALQLQQQIAAQGLHAALRAVSKIDPDEPLGQQVLAAHQNLQKGNWP